jgi:hypothetical protein
VKLKFVLFVFGALAVWQSASALRAQTTLANALDNPNLVWTTGGTGGVGWLYEAQDVLGGDNTFDGTASARSGAIGNNGESWLATTVAGPGTVSFWWNAYSEPDADWLEFYVNSNRQDRISGVLPGNPSGWSYRSYAVPAGTNALTWRYVKDGSLTGGTLDKAWVDQVSYVTSPSPALQEALNTCGVGWTSGGNVNATAWFGQTNVTHDGKCSAQSGAIWHNQTNWLQATVSGITNVSFWWKVSSELNADYLEFYTNNVRAKAISGEAAWQSNYFRLPATTNILKWLYRRDSSGTVGTNCGWVDQVAFSPSFRASPYCLQSPTRLPDGRMQLTVSGESGCGCQIQVSTNLINWATLTNFTTLSAHTGFLDNGATNSPVRFYRGVSP